MRRVPLPKPTASRSFSPSSPVAPSVLRPGPSVPIAPSEEVGARGGRQVKKVRQTARSL